MANERLRAQRTLRGWSQEDVVRGLVRVGIELGERQLGVSRQLISRWEREGTTPRAPYPKLLCQLFGTSAEELGLVAPSPPASACVRIEETTIEFEDDVERREFLGLFYTAARGAAVWAVVPSGMRPGAVSSVASSEGESTTLEALTAITGSYRRLDDRTASLELLPLALGHLSHVSNVARRSGSAAGRRSLWAAASEAAGLAGGLAFDAGDHAQTSSHYRTAIAFAERAGNPLLQAFSLGMMSSFRAETGQGARAVQLIEKGKTLLPASVPPTIEARMATYEANAYSSVGDTQQALGALGRADTASEQIQADGEMFWPLIFPFDPGRRARERGACATRLKEPEIALAALEEGLEALGSGASKRRALVLSDLAESYTVSGEIEEACRLLGEAFTAGIQLRSHRVLNRVRKVRGELDPWKGTKGVKELDERLLASFLN
ncbi:MAG TPA: helix-turn-helix transcriptional regulator [Actinomycetota bacterium]|nr:helix-turn-helix transcriptional regulator [Actinomycetota bacterium]